MTARGQRNALTGRITRKLALCGVGAAAVAMPLMGATVASAADQAPAAAAPAAPAPAAPAPAAGTFQSSPGSTVSYLGNNLDGWIRQALVIMKANDIPGSYDGIYRNVMRESSGNPQAINLWDSNAAKGIPSKGLLQVIDPTFQTYHVEGTANDPYDPVANIVAACNYAADRYGSMDNVNSAY